MQQIEDYRTVNKIMFLEQVMAREHKKQLDGKQILGRGVQNIKEWARIVQEAKEMLYI